MNPYFSKNQHALPEKLQEMVNEKNTQIELVNKIKGLCYDMLVEILEEAEKNQRSPNSSWLWSWGNLMCVITLIQSLFN